MSKNMKECMTILKVIASLKNKKQREKILKEFNGDECLYKALREIAVNTVNRNIKLSSKQKRNLIKYKSVIKSLTKPYKSKSKRKKLIIQSGGFLPYLIPAAISLLTTLIRK